MKASIKQRDQFQKRLGLGLVFAPLPLLAATAPLNAAYIAFAVAMPSVTIGSLLLITRKRTLHAAN